MFDDGVQDVTKRGDMYALRTLVLRGGGVRIADGMNNELTPIIRGYDGQDK